MKHFFNMVLVLFLMAMLTGCTVDSDTQGLVDDYKSPMLFNGHYSNSLIDNLGHGAEIPDYLLIFDDDFIVTMYGDTLTINQSLIEMFVGYRDTIHTTKMKYYEKGYSADRSTIIYGLDVPPMEWIYMPTGPEGEHIAIRTEFSSQSEAIYNSYSGTLDIILYSDRQYHDGELYSHSSITYSLTARRVN